MLKKNLKFLGFIILILSFLIPIGYAGTNNIMQISNEKTIESKIATNNYYALLTIPKINLNQEIYPLTSKENNVNQNLQLIKGSTMPTENISNVIIAGHSGSGLHAYFKDLYKLQVGDTLNFLYSNYLYTYEIKEIEYQAKTGELYLKEEYPHMLTLITCTKNNSKTQTIYYCKLLKKSKNS